MTRIVCDVRLFWLKRVNRLEISVVPTLSAVANWFYAILLLLFRARREAVVARAAVVVMARPARRRRHRRC